MSENINEKKQEMVIDEEELKKAIEKTNIQMLFKWKGSINSLDEVIDLPERVKVVFGVESLFETGFSFIMSQNNELKKIGFGYIKEAVAIFASLGRDFVKDARDDLKQLKQLKEGAVKENIDQLEKDFDEIYNLVSSALSEIDIEE